MTRDEILAMEAGPELDALMAEHVFGNHFCAVHHSFYCCGRSSGGWSSKIAPAWEIVEKLRLAVGPAADYDYDTNWYATKLGSKIHGAIGSTAPLAICRAALMLEVNND